MTPLIVLTVAGAGAVGASIRYLVTLAMPSRTPESVPVGILVVNLAGSAIAGAVLGLASRGGLSPDIVLVLATGFCGGLTTFSTFSVETLQLIERGAWRPALLNTAANLGVGTALALATYLATR